MSKLGSNAPSALHRLLWQAQKLGTILETPLADSHTDRWRLPRCFILYEKTEDSIFDPPPLPDSPLSLTRDTKTCFKDTRPHHSGGGKERGDKGASCSTDNIIPYSLRSPIAMWSPTHFTNAEPDTTTGATDIRGSSKRTAVTAGLNDGSESVHPLEKARRAGQCAAPSPCGRV